MEGNNMRNNNTKRRNGIIAAALGAALLMGGGTFALWMDSANLAGGSIATGELSIEQSEDPVAAYDMSPDVVENSENATNLFNTEEPDAVPIQDPASFTMVPGDTIALKFEYTVTLVGNNIAANLFLDGIDGTDGILGTSGLDPAYWNIGYRVSIGGETSDLIDYTDNTDPLNGDTPLGETAAAGTPVVLWLIVSFDEDTTATSAQEDMGLTINLVDASNQVSLRLQQVRPS